MSVPDILGARSLLHGMIVAADCLTTRELDILIEALIEYRDLRDPDPDLEPEEDADVEDDAAAVALMEPEDRRVISAQTTRLSEIEP